jgi:hypothetical protein
LEDQLSAMEAKIEALLAQAEEEQQKAAERASQGGQQQQGETSS